MLLTNLLFFFSKCVLSILTLYKTTKKNSYHSVFTSITYTSLTLNACQCNAPRMHHFIIKLCQLRTSANFFPLTFISHTVPYKSPHPQSLPISLLPFNDQNFLHFRLSFAKFPCCWQNRATGSECFVLPRKFSGCCRPQDNRLCAIHDTNMFASTSL